MSPTSKCTRRLGSLGRLLVLPALALPVPAQQALLALDDGAAGHDLWAVQNGTILGQQVLSSVEFRTLELAGFALRDRLRIDIPVEHDQDAVCTVQLPGQGSLCLLGRAGSSLLVQIADSGALEVLLEVSDGATAGLLGALAVRSDGARGLAATSIEAGGDVLLLDLAGNQPPVSLTAGLPPLAIDGNSLRVGQGRAWFVADGELHRVDLTGPPAAEALDLSLAPGDVLLPELATSSNGDWVALLSQQPSGLRHIHVAPPTGTAQRVTGTAADYDGPGLDQADGPLLALSDDGAFVAWRQTIGPAREIFLERVPAPGAPEQITGDHQFVDTIDNAAILGFQGGVFVFAAGEMPDAVGQALGSADFFAIDVGTGNPSAPQNITQTSGEVSPPFTQTGELEILQALVDPLAQRLLLDVDPNDGDHALLSIALDGQPGLTTWITGLLAPPQFEPAGESVFVLVQPEPGPFDPPGIVTQQLHLLSPVGAPNGLRLLAAVTWPQPLLFDRFASDASGSRAAFVVSAAPGFEIPVLVDLASGALAPLWGELMAVAPRMAFAPSGALVVGLGLVGGPFLYAAFTAPFVGSLYFVPLAGGFPFGA